MKYTVIQKLLCRTLSIEGMTCNSCETRIERSLNKLEGVRRAKADYINSKVHVVYDGNVYTKDIFSTIENLGYDISDSERCGRNYNTRENTTGNVKSLDKKSAKDKKPTTDKNGPKDENIEFFNLLALGIIIFLSYRTFQNLGLNFLPQINQNMGYGILFIVGLLTSLHCIAMCGGINLSQCVNGEFSDHSKKTGKFGPSLLYNTGRVISYTVVGGIVGAIGSAVSFNGWAKGIVAVIAGSMMVIMGLNMLNVFPSLRKLNPRLPVVFKRLSAKNRKRGPFVVGLLNGLMPCGPLQAMQLYALGTGSIVVGAASMFFFSLGTVPLMFGLGAISSFLSSKFTHKMMRTSAVLVVVLGIIMLTNGLSLSGIALPKANSGSTVKAVVSGNIQTVTTNLESGRYTPIIVQKGIPVQWTIKVEEDDINGCNNPLTVPKYDFAIELRPGDNIIEFIPQEEGSIVYTCWMGMIRSNITIVEDIKKI